VGKSRWYIPTHIGNAGFPEPHEWSILSLAPAPPVTSQLVTLCVLEWPSTGPRATVRMSEVRLPDDTTKANEADDGLYDVIRRGPAALVPPFDVQ